MSLGERETNRNPGYELNCVGERGEIVSYVISDYNVLVHSVLPSLPPGPHPFLLISLHFGAQRAAAPSPSCRLCVSSLVLHFQHSPPLPPPPPLPHPPPPPHPARFCCSALVRLASCIVCLWRYFPPLFSVGCFLRSVFSVVLFFLFCSVAFSTLHKCFFFFSVWACCLFEVT